MRSNVFLCTGARADLKLRVSWELYVQLRSAYALRFSFSSQFQLSHKFPGLHISYTRSTDGSRHAVLRVRKVLSGGNVMASQEYVVVIYYRLLPSEKKNSGYQLRLFTDESRR